MIAGSKGTNISAIVDKNLSKGFIFFLAYSLLSSLETSFKSKRAVIVL